MSSAKTRDQETEAAVAAAIASIEDIPESSLLSRQYHFVVPSVVALYFALEYGISSNGNMCRTGSRPPFSNLTHQMEIAAALCFSFSLFHNVVVGVLLKWDRTQKKLNHARDVHIAAATVNLVAGISATRAFFSNDERICLDALGVETYASQWAEWISIVPFLTYTAIAVEDKPYLDRKDIVFIFLVGMSILCGFALTHLSEKVFGMITFIFGCFCVGVTLVEDVFQSQAAKMKEIIMEKGADLTPQEIWALTRSRTKNRLSWLLLIFLPSFPGVYFLAVMKIFDRDQLVISNVILGLFAKLFFVGALAQDSVLVELSREMTSHESRRRFLRYVFHEVRVPLNTITMGLSVVKNDDVPLSENTQEALDMMEGAAKYMSSTLNDVLSMSKIEDGAMQLDKRPFKVHKLVSGAVDTMMLQAEAKEIRIKLDYDRSLPEFIDARKLVLIGDALRLQQVVVNLLSNAVKYSANNSSVVIRVTATVVEDRQNAISALRQSLVKLSLGGKEQQSTARAAANGEGAHTDSASGSASAVPTANTPLQGDGGSSSSAASSSSLHSSAVDHRHHAADDNAELDEEQIMKDHHTQPGESKVELTILVCDNGIGVSKENMKKLFVPYGIIRPHDHTDEGHGSGLGLVFSKQIIDLHGGKMRMDSVEGKGSRFGFSIVLPSVPRQRVYRAAAAIGQPVGDHSEFNTNTYGSPALSPSTPHHEPVNYRHDKVYHEKVVSQNLKHAAAVLTTSTTTSSSITSTGAGSPRKSDDVKTNNTPVDAAPGTINTKATPPAPPAPSSILPPESIGANHGSASVADSAAAASSSAAGSTPATIVGTAAPLAPPQASSQASTQPTQPAASEATSAPGPESRRASISAPPSSIETKFHGLIVDDTASNRKMLNMLLNKRAVVNDMAINGVESVVAVRENFDKYDVIFMDYTMPEMNGAEATLAIRELGYNRIIVGITGNALDDDVARLMKAGIDFVFFKPFRDDQLRVLLEYISTHGNTTSEKVKRDLKDLFSKK